MSKKAARIGVTVFVVGSLATFALALILWRTRHPVLAADVVLASPFPCPPGLPC